MNFGKLFKKMIDKQYQREMENAKGIRIVRYAFMNVVVVALGLMTVSSMIAEGL